MKYIPIAFLALALSACAIDPNNTSRVQIDSKGNITVENDEHQYTYKQNGEYQYKSKYGQYQRDYDRHHHRDLHAKHCPPGQAKKGRC